MDADIPAVVERWTPETLSTVMDALAWVDDTELAAEAALTALAEAGLLLPPVGRTRIEWSATLRASNGFLLPVNDVYRPFSRREDAESVVETLAEDVTDLPKLTAVLVRRSVVTWPDGSQHIGAWAEVTPDG